MASVFLPNVTCPPLFERRARDIAIPLRKFAVATAQNGIQNLAITKTPRPEKFAPVEAKAVATPSFLQQ